MPEHTLSFLPGTSGKQSSKIQVIVTFLAILELMKTGDYHRTEHLFDDIQITSFKI